MSKMKIRPEPPTHDVYRNLHSKTWSVIDRRAGKVVDHPDETALTGVTLVVQPAGNKKVRETQKKLVHAFVRGRAAPIPPAPHFDRDEVLRTGVRITYNPYKHTSFVVEETGKEVKEADWVFLFADKSVWAINPR